MLLVFCYIQILVPVRCGFCLKEFSFTSNDHLPVNVHVLHIIKMKRESLKQHLEVEQLKSTNNFLREKLQVLTGHKKTGTVASKPPTTLKRPAADNSASDLLGLNDITVHTVTPKTVKVNQPSSAKLM